MRNIKVKTDRTISSTIRTMSFKFDLMGCFTGLIYWVVSLFKMENIKITHLKGRRWGQF